MLSGGTMRPSTKPSTTRRDTNIFSRFSKRYIIIAATAIAALLALILGLSIGLTLRSKRQNLPLPTNHGGTYTGDLTYYGPGLGACGVTSSESDDIVSISHLVFDAVQKGSDPNSNPLCGMKLRARRPEGTTSVDLTVVDRCTGCKSTDIDVSPGAFGKLANIDEGRVTVDWAWLEDVANQ